MKNTIIFINKTDLNIDYQVKDVLGIFIGVEGNLTFKLMNKQYKFELNDDKGSAILDLLKLEGDIQQIRKYIKKELYIFLSNRYQNFSPWGVLTGIRPSKLAHDLLLKNSIEDTIHILENEYLVESDKAHLLTNVANVEKRILESVKHNDASLYIGIPFCPSICSYCSFSSYSINSKNSKPVEYIEALNIQLAKMAKQIKLEGKVIRTIYIGGGTPTSISAHLLEKLLMQINNTFNIKEVKEFTVEAGRPDSITYDKLEVLKKFGVSRISINPQSMCDDTLKRIGRNHSRDQIFKAFEMAKTVGFETINMDLIAGLPGETCNDFIFSLNEVRKLSPENITVHALARKRASALTKNNEKYYSIEEINECEKMFEYLYKFMGENEYIPYYMYRQKNMIANQENIGYCKKGKECEYNIYIIEEKQSIYACGCGGVSKIYYPEEDRLERIPNFKDPKLFIEKYLK